MQQGLRIFFIYFFYEREQVEGQDRYYIHIIEIKGGGRGGGVECMTCGLYGMRDRIRATRSLNLISFQTSMSFWKI